MFLLLVALARAGTIAWAWPVDQPVSWYCKTSIRTPSGHWVLGTANDMARAVRHDLELDLTCRARPDGKNWMLECATDSASVTGVAKEGEQEALDRIFEGYGRMLGGSTWQVVQKSDGRVTDIDLEGVSKSDDRQAKIHEALRQYGRHVLAAIDFQTPRKEPGDKPWKQGGSPLLFEQLTALGTAGGATLRHRVASRREADVTIESEGEASTILGAALDARSAGASTSDNTWHSTSTGRARFDTSVGLLDWRAFTVEARSSMIGRAAGGEGIYEQETSIARKDAGGVPERPEREAP